MAFFLCRTFRKNINDNDEDYGIHKHYSKLVPPERYTFNYHQYLEYPITNIEIQNTMIGIGDQICKYIMQRIIDNKRNKEDVKK